MLAHDDEQAVRTRAVVLGEPLDTHSVEELAERVDRLRDEIARVEDVLNTKKASRDAADLMFRR